MLTKDEAATLESLIRRMSCAERDGLEHWLESWYDFGEDGNGGQPLVPPRSGRLPDTWPLWEDLKEAEWCAEHVPWLVEKGGVQP